MQRIIDIFEPEINFAVEEASGEVDGKHILAKVRGQFFVPEGISRNRRFYSRSLWEKTIEKVKDRLKNRTMFGTIGHEQEIGDSALLEGKVSHVITDLYIDEKGRGIGEALILNTPAGRILNTLLRAGSKLYVSSRAEGKYNGTKNGVPVVDEESYELKGFDFVIDPGFLQAQPSLVESLQKDIDYCFSKQCKQDQLGGAIMDTAALLETKVKENLKLQEELNKALEQLEELKKKVGVLEAKNEELSKELEGKGKVEEELKQIKEELEKYKELGTVEEVGKALEEAKKIIEGYKELGSPEEVDEALEKAKEILESYKELGTPEEIKEALEKSKELLEKYKELGTPKEIEKVFEKVDVIISESIERSKQQKIEALAKELGVSAEAIAKVYDKMSEEEIKEFFKELSEQVKIKEKYEKKEDKKEGDGKDNAPLFESRGSRLLKYFNG